MMKDLSTNSTLGPTFPAGNVNLQNVVVDHSRDPGVCLWLKNHQFSGKMEIQRNPEKI